MLVVAERFFCPSLELISEYLRLPPCVAGATLLSFGNGAPDVFTQLAAISQGDSGSSSPAAISMALSEPLGSGLFVGNVVFALVVFFSGLSEVPVQRSYFLKDCLFYLGGVAAVFALLLHGVVMVWEVALLAVYYVGFILVTILLSRGDEPVHADPRLHEVPHRLKPADSFMRESFRRLPDFSWGGAEPLATDNDLTAPLLAPPAPAWTPSYSCHSRKSNPGLEPIDESDLRDEEGSETAADDDDSELPDAGGVPPPLAETASAASEALRWLSDLDPGLDPAEVRRLRQQGGADGAGAGAGAGACPGPARLTEPSTAVLTTEGGGFGAAAPTRPYGADGARELSGGSPVETSGVGGFGGFGSAFRGGGGGMSYGGEVVLGLGRPSLDRTPSLRRTNSGRPPSRMEQLWRRVEKPGLVLLSLFIPRVAIDTTHARYRKTTAVLLPPVLPTLVGWAQGWLQPEAAPGGFWRQTWWLVATGAGLAVALAALLFYPRKGHLHGYAAGIATVIVFCEAMFLLDASAGELVSAAVALGQIYGISPSLLGATLLAWGNSVSDLVSNITLAMDGLPTMAITACFASPLFVLLAGLVTSLTYATRHGEMELPHDLALRVLYGSSTAILLMWAIVVPLVFHFRLDRRVGMLAVAVYLAYQVVYITAVVHDSR